MKGMLRFIRISWVYIWQYFLLLALLTVIIIINSNFIGRNIKQTLINFIFIYRCILKSNFRHANNNHFSDRALCNLNISKSFWFSEVKIRLSSIFRMQNTFVLLSHLLIKMPLHLFTISTSYLVSCMCSPVSLCLCYN